MNRASEAASAAANDWLKDWDAFSPLSCRDDLAHAFDRFASERAYTPSHTDTVQPSEEQDRRELEEIVATWRSSLVNPATWATRLRSLLSGPVQPSEAGEVERLREALEQGNTVLEGRGTGTYDEACDAIRRQNAALDWAITTIDNLAPTAGHDAETLAGLRRVRTALTKEPRDER